MRQKKVHKFLAANQLRVRFVQEGLSIFYCLTQLQGGPYITANLYCICFSIHEKCAEADAVQIRGNILYVQEVVTLFI